MERHCAPEIVSLRRLRYASSGERVENTGEPLKFLGSRIKIYKIYSIENSAEKHKFLRGTGTRSRPFEYPDYAVSSRRCMVRHRKCPHSSALEETPEKQS